MLLLQSLDVELRLRLAAWLSLHVSNGDFHWPWASWAYVADEPGHNPRRWATRHMYSASDLVLF